MISSVYVQLHTQNCHACSAKVGQLPELAQGLIPDYVHLKTLLERCKIPNQELSKELRQQKKILTDKVSNMASGLDDRQVNTCYQVVKCIIQSASKY